MAVMIYVYVRISCVVASRHDKMTEIEVHKVGVPFPRGRVLNDKICSLTNGVDHKSQITNRRHANKMVIKF